MASIPRSLWVSLDKNLSGDLDEEVEPSHTDLGNDDVLDPKEIEQAKAHLSEMSQLVLVDLQKSHLLDVIETLKRIGDLLMNDDYNWNNNMKTNSQVVGYDDHDDEKTLAETIDQEAEEHNQLPDELGSQMTCSGKETEGYVGRKQIHGGSRNGPLIQKNEVGRHMQDVLWTGGHVLVVLTMRKWSYEEAIQEYALSCLVAMTYRSNDACTSVARSGGIETIIAALKRFPNSSEVQGHGITAILNTFSVLDQPQERSLEFIRPLSVRFVEEYRGLELVEKARTLNQDDEHLVICLCGLLDNLACNKELQSLLIKKGAVTVVGGVLQRHYDHEKVRSYALSFLKIIASVGDN